MEWWHVYLFTRIDSLKGLIEACTVLCMIAGIISLVAMVLGKMLADSNKKYGENDSDYTFGLSLYTFSQVALKKSFWILVPAMFLNITVPTQKEVAAIYMLPKLVNSQAVAELQPLPKDVARILTLKVEQYLNDLEKEVKSKKEDKK